MTVQILIFSGGKTKMPNCILWLTIIVISLFLFSCSSPSDEDASDTNTTDTSSADSEETSSSLIAFPVDPSAVQLLTVSATVDIDSIITRTDLFEGHSLYNQADITVPVGASISDTVDETSISKNVSRRKLLETKYTEADPAPVFIQFVNGRYSNASWIVDGVAELNIVSTEGEGESAAADAELAIVFLDHTCDLSVEVEAFDFSNCITVLIPFAANDGSRVFRMTASDQTVDFGRLHLAAGQSVLNDSSLYFSAESAEKDILPYDFVSALGLESIHYYPFDSQGDSGFPDVSSNGDMVCLDALVSGDTANGTGGAIQFDGISSVCHAEYENDGIFPSLEQVMSFSFFANIEDNGDEESVILAKGVKGAGTNNGFSGVFQHETLGSKFKFSIFTEAGLSVLNSDELIPYGQWSMVSTTIDFANRELSVFIDGQEVVSECDCNYGVIDAGSELLNIGARREIDNDGAISGSGFFKGKLDEVRFSTEIITANEIYAEFVNFQSQAN